MPERHRAGSGGAAAIREILEYAAVRLLLASLRVPPYRCAIAMSEALGLACGKAVSKWGRTAVENLRRALPDLDADARREVLNGVFRNLGRVAFALANCPHWSRRTVSEHVEFRGLEHFRQAQSKRRGVLLLTAHLGNWELGALAHGAVVGPLHVMVRPLKNARVDWLIERLRSAHGNQVISKRNAARRVLRTLRENGTVGILADQNAVREEAVFVQFFGRTAAANKGLAQIALRSRAAVVPATAWWDSRRRLHVVEYGPQLDVTRSDNVARDVRDNSQLFQLTLEDCIRRHPEQWLWIHRRWNTQPPPGEKSP